MLRNAVLISALLVQLGMNSVSGVVLDAVTSEPVADVLAILSTSSGNTQKVATASDGRFVLNDVAPGSYTLQFGRSGYVTESYGERNFQNSAKPVIVRAGQPVDNIAMRLTPTGVVSGRIRSTELQPMIGVPVRLLHYIYKSDGRRNLELSGVTRTNDRGEYRLFGVRPGRYILAAGGIAPHPRKTEDINPNDVTAETELTFYPSTIDLDLAKLLDISAGSELRGTDFVLGVQRLIRISGRVSVRGVSNLSVSAILQPEDILGNLWGNSSADPSTGSFEISGLRPGQYVLSATVDGGSTSRMKVRLGERDLDDIELKMEEAGNLFATILLNGEPWQPTPRFATILGIEDLENEVTSGARLEPDGSVTISNLPSGTYRPFLYNLPPGCYLKTATFGEVDVIENRLKLDGASSAALKILVSSKAASLHGIVRNSRNETAPRAAMVLVPNRRDRRELYSMAVSNENGEFEFGSVAPGEYKVFAWESIEQYSWMDPSVIAQFEDKGRAIRFEELAKENIDVQVIPAKSHP